ncbi:MAG TPA: DUF6438 domain-containing protein [Flavobacteriales bacterium]
MRRITIITALAILITFSMIFTSCNKSKEATKTAATEVALPTPPNPPAPPAVTEIPVPPTSSAAQEMAPVIEYRRTPCFGTCPIFNFKVYENGRAVYEGKNFVDMIGTFYSTVTPEQVQKIIDVAEQIQFFKMKDVYDEHAVTDLPSVYVTLSKNGELKTVKNRYQGPKELKLLYDELDALIQVLTWIPGEKNPDE